MPDEYNYYADLARQVGASEAMKIVTIINEVILEAKERGYPTAISTNGFGTDHTIVAIEGRLSVIIQIQVEYRDSMSRRHSVRQRQSVEFNPKNPWFGNCLHGLAKKMFEGACSE